MVCVDYQALASQLSIEVREHERYKSAHAARLRLSDGRFMDCRLVNVSAGGALIDLSDLNDLPDEFNLIIATADFEAACEVRHMRRLESHAGANILRAGVMFMSNRLTALQRFG
jgi:hypothetical protein